MYFPENKFIVIVIGIVCNIGPKNTSFCAQLCVVYSEPEGNLFGDNIWM